MGHIIKTPAGTFRANWRDATGKQKAKTFPTKREASAFLAETEASITRGGYVDPHAGRAKFGPYALRWVASRQIGARAKERLVSIMRTHVLPQWADWPLGKIDHIAVQQWITSLSERRAPATVAKCFTAMSAVMRSAVRSRLIAADPTEDIQRPSTYRAAGDLTTITREQFFGALLPALAPEDRALVCMAAGAGLRWGETVGMPWGMVDLDGAQLHVRQVVMETSRGITIKPFPKSRAGRRTVPMHAFLVDALRARLPESGELPDPSALVFTTRTGVPPRRSNFRRNVWRPALVRAGLLGKVTESGAGVWAARWVDAGKVEHRAEFRTEREMVAHVAKHAHGGLRFHDLRHSYATWLVSDGLRVNVVRRVLGHEQASTTLNFYVHTPDDFEDDVRAVFDVAADFPLTTEPESGADDSTDEGEEPLTS
jgi:integrase